MPTTTFDEKNKLANLDVDIDEGKQFYVSDISFEGLDESGRKRLTRELYLKPGDIYNGRLWELSQSRIASFFPDADATRQIRVIWMSARAPLRLRWISDPVYLNNQELLPNPFRILR